MSAIQRQFCIEKSRWEFEFCPLSGIKKHPLLGGCFSITSILISIRNTELVCYREVVCFSGRGGGVRYQRLNCIYQEVYTFREFAGDCTFIICSHYYDRNLLYYRQFDISLGTVLFPICILLF